MASAIATSSIPSPGSRATGYPVTAWRSVSVLAPLAVAAGACATIAMLKGAEAPAFLANSGNAWLAQDAAGAMHGNGI
jgi:FAD:protein FMN transferase